MRIAGRYSFNNGQKIVESQYRTLIAEIKAIIKNTDADCCKTKTSKEKTMPGKILYSPRVLNGEFKKQFSLLKWETKRIRCDYPTKFYEKTYKPHQLNNGAFREMDFIKRDLGVEVQFGK